MNRELIPYLDRLAAVFAAIDHEYARLAQHYERFSCEGCIDNCCTTVFYHYTLIEHLLLVRGLGRLSDAQLTKAVRSAEDYMRELVRNPDVTALSMMCPLNFEGRCGTYEHRPLICRIHGLPSLLQTPRGAQRWKGCLRFQAQHGSRIDREMNRTKSYSVIAAIEADLRQHMAFFQKYRKTIAEMLLDWTADGATVIKSISESP